MVVNSWSLRLVLPAEPIRFRSSTLLRALGVAVDRNGLIYFVDGTMIRKVDLNGIISTVLGSHDLTSARPLTCDTSMHIRQVPCNIIPKRWNC